MAAPSRCRDAHTHLSAGAWELSDCDLRDAGSLREIVERVARAAGSRPSGEWIRGWGWCPEILGDPDAADAALCRAVKGRPVVLGRSDGHAAWLSAAAAEALGLGRASQVVVGESFDAARRRLPAPTPSELEAALLARIEELAAAGVTMVDDFVEPWGPEAWARAGSRVAGLAAGLWLPESTGHRDAEALRRAMPPRDRRLAVRGVKVFLDGTLASRTAALSAPYADAPEDMGELRYTRDEIHERIARWAGHGWPVAIHAIGDRAVSSALDALASAPRPSWGAHRIEHAQVVRRVDLPRFAAVGVVASVQPGHWRDDRAFLSSRIGARDDVVVHPLGSLVRAGATVLFGSDWPVSSWNPGTVLGAACDPDRGVEALVPEVARHLMAAPSDTPPA